MKISELESSPVTQVWILINVQGLRTSYIMEKLSKKGNDCPYPFIRNTRVSHSRSTIYIEYGDSQKCAFSGKNGIS